AGGDVVEAEVFDGHAAGDFFPGQRGGHARARGRAHRVDRGERPAPGVLVVVDEDVTGRAVRLAVFRGDQPDVPARQVEGQRLGERPDLLLRRPAHDRHVDVDAPGPGRLRV